VTPAAFDAVPGGQGALLVGCRALAQAAGASQLPPLAWRDVPRFPADTAVTIVPSVSRHSGNRARDRESPRPPGTGWRGPRARWTRVRLACGKLPGNCSAIRYATTRCAGQRTAGHGTTVLPIEEHFGPMAANLSRLWGARIGVSRADAFTPVSVLGRLPGRRRL